jgi:hypothetical protein
MNTVLMIMVMSINGGFAKDIQVGWVLGNLLWAAITADMVI